jgi:2-C-methyl-D-erythritol 4-phosphate cytidylyltransferase
MPQRIMIVVAGGESRRFGGDKMMALIDGRPLVAYTVRAVVGHVDRCILVGRHDQVPLLSELRLGVEIVAGGATRTASEMAGLRAVDDQDALIGIHDGARPLVPGQLVEDLFSAAGDAGGAIPVLGTDPTLRRSDMSVVEGLVVAQTPQVFAGDRLVAAYRRATGEGAEGTDTAEIAHRFGSIETLAIPGSAVNLKVTFPHHLEVVRAVLEAASRSEPR